MSDVSACRNQLRAEMPIVNRFAYLDHAAVAPIPRAAAQIIRQFAEESSCEGDTRWLDWSEKAGQTREFAARLIGSSVDEIALVPNTTYGISIVAESFPWRTGENVVVPENEFPSNLLPWRNLNRRGVEIRLVPVDASGELTATQIAPYIDHRTRLVALSWVGFSSGYRCDLTSISQTVHSKGALLFVDAIQGLGAFALSVKEAGIDFLAADGHKWLLGPEGAGILYIKGDHLESLSPIGIGWNSLAAAGFDPRSTQLKSTAARYEGGSGNLVGFMSLSRSLELLTRLGAGSNSSGFQQAVLENVSELGGLLEQAGFRTTLPASPENQSGILGITWPEADRQGDSAYLQARKFLLGQNIVVSIRSGRIRAATHAYNCPQDHQQLVDALVEFRAMPMRD